MFWYAETALKKVLLINNERKKCPGRRRERKEKKNYQRVRHSKANINTSTVKRVRPIRMKMKASRVIRSFRGCKSEFPTRNFFRALSAAALHLIIEKKKGKKNTVFAG